MHSKAATFCLGVVTGLGGTIGLYRMRTRPQLLESSAELEESQNDSLIFRYGHPEPMRVSDHTYTAHALSYDHVKKVPVWVAESVSKDMVTGHANRKSCNFQPDPNLPVEWCSSNEDYRGSGWSRGHMAPAGNYKHCQQSMGDTFYLTNIVPQDKDNNAGYWNSVEDYCRRLAKRYSKVNIISGPLYLPKEDPENKKKFVKYEVIGRSNVAVPTHLYKIILAEDGTISPPMLGVFVIPNERIGEVSLTQFQVSLEEVESQTCIKFHSKLDRSKVRDLCTTDGCKLRHQKDWDVITYRNRVQTAASSEELEKIWREVEAKGIQHDKGLNDLYSKRKTDLQTVTG